MDEDNRDSKTDHHRLVVADARARVFVTVIPARRVTRNCSLCGGRDPKYSELVLTGGDADVHDIDVRHGSAIVNNACQKTMKPSSLCQQCVYAPAMPRKLS